ncbi:MAG: trypsin-like peptidase domain-containing protein [Chloroflexi bacterium]|nr:trypsin-like peptidase domain-containing protein [Chloroflexota bacterium]
MRQDRPFRSISPNRSDPPGPAHGLPISRLAGIRQRLARFYPRVRGFLLLGAGIAIAVSAILVYDATRPAPQRLTQRDIDAAVVRSLEKIPPKPSFSSQVYEVIRPSLVRVRAVKRNSDNEVEGGIGAGFVVQDNGTILTSLHVVKDAEEVRVTFADGTRSRASIIVQQPENDLAVLLAHEIPDDLEPVTMASSASLRVGDEVVAVGNPFGFRNSLSSGVVSGLGRSLTSKKSGQTLRNLIQFDAAVNPGNSGGPLVNRDGEVVGIVTALVNPIDQEFFIGIGFAVPIETAAGASGSPPV